jgi:hypothetical protein
VLETCHSHTSTALNVRIGKGADYCKLGYTQAVPKSIHWDITHLTGLEINILLKQMRYSGCEQIFFHAKENSSSDRSMGIQLNFSWDKVS